jgi:hypothetical protein
MMSNYLIFLDTGEGRSKSSPLYEFYKIIALNESLKKGGLHMLIRNWAGLSE